jgi:3-dehydroquinate synthase
MSKIISHKIGNSITVIHFGFPIELIHTLIPQEKIILITDHHLLELYQEKINKFQHIIIPAGEENKIQQSINYIVSRLLEMNADKDSCIVGLGGGVVTDMAGYVASIYKRGVRLILAPTSVLGMVDACLGGKNGINTGDYKNMIGTIYQPEAILYDLRFLKTLPQVEWVSGFAEIIKHACIADLNMLEHLETKTLEDFQQNEDLMETLIRRNVDIKMEIVKRDELEKHDRKLLNFGHTLGHAIEREQEIPHGHAVAIGMLFASFVSNQLQFITTDDLDRIACIIRRYHLPTQYHGQSERIFDAVLQDKKRAGDGIQFVLLESLGRGFTKSISMTAFKDFLKSFHS